MLIIVYKQRDPIASLVSALSVSMIKEIAVEHSSSPSAPSKSLNGSMPEINLHFGSINVERDERRTVGFRSPTPLAARSMDAVSICFSEASEEA